jgi:SAM-dependent methyltransferase
MSFPHHDRNWVEVADFLDAHIRTGDRILAPDRIWWRLSRPVDRWVGTNLRPAESYNWVVAHKGELPQFPRDFLEMIGASMTPVLANEVFVVWGRGVDGALPVDESDPHLIAFHGIVAGLPPVPVEPNSYEQDRILGAQPRLARFADMSDRELRAAQNAFFRTGGYEYVTARDRAYYEDLHGHVDGAVQRWARARVLDVACGSLPIESSPPQQIVVRTDLAEEGVRLAARADVGNAGCVHATMDAHALGFPDATFDAVLFVDAIEHVRSASRVMGEIARVLRAGGELLLTYANRNSVNQVMMRKLGYPEFVTNHQHIEEFSPSDIECMLDAAGLEVTETAGVSLLPYWGIPGIDEVVRDVTDNDPEVVEMMRVLGARAGEYAYTGVVLARKR